MKFTYSFLDLQLTDLLISITYIIQSTHSLRIMQLEAYQSQKQTNINLVRNPPYHRQGWFTVSRLEHIYGENRECTHVRIDEASWIGAGGFNRKNANSFKTLRRQQCNVTSQKPQSRSGKHELGETVRLRNYIICAK